MVEQPRVKPQEAKPKEAKAPDKPPGPPGPPASGPASDYGIGGGGGGGGGIGGGGGGSEFGWYASEVSSRIHDALSQNQKTRMASLRLKVRVWPDRSGRITRVELGASSGDPAVDAAIKNEVLDGLVLPDPPPANMPLPIVLRIVEQRPN
jgi:outer membrane biosynthesis protein TonB